MEKKKKREFNLGLIVGIAGVVAGIYLLFAGDTLIGIFGTIASAFLAYQSYTTAQKSKQ